MNKVGIVTYALFYNYGTALQAYALQQAVASSEEQIINLLKALDDYKDYHVIFTYSNSDTSSQIIIKRISEYVKRDAEMSVAAVPCNVSIPYGILDLDGRDIKGLLEKHLSW